MAQSAMPEARFRRDGIMYGRGIYAARHNTFLVHLCAYVPSIQWLKPDLLYPYSPFPSLLKSISFLFSPGLLS